MKRLRKRRQITWRQASVHAHSVARDIPPRLITRADEVIA
jgi:hypothetical protein